MKAWFGSILSTKVLGIIVCLLIASWGHASAQTWTQVSSPNTNWNFVVCSANGTTLACTPYPLLFSSGRTGPGLIYISTNSGMSWTAGNVGSPATGNWSWTCLAMSADGTRLVADSNDVAIYASTNTGTSWSPILTPKNSGEGLGPVATSADGNRLYVADSASRIYTSTNSGQTWATNLSPFTVGLTSMVCSADGHSLIANYEFNFNLSTNFGLSWTNISQRVDLSEDRSVGCASADGSVLTIKADGGAVISTNSGITWSLNNDDQNPGHTIQAACSADGSRLIASQENDYPGGIYLSTNTGATWQYFTNAGTEDYLVAASADGCQFVASGTNGIYLLQTVPTPRLNLVSSATNLTLTWIVPSTHFTLQQSSDLISWNEITNAPALNAGNLQNQLSLPPSPLNTFYRLSTQ